MEERFLHVRMDPLNRLGKKEESGWLFYFFYLRAPISVMEMAVEINIWLLSSQTVQITYKAFIAF